jgi:hypothetical protein
MKTEFEKLVDKVALEFIKGIPSPELMKEFWDFQIDSAFKRFRLEHRIMEIKAEMIKA